MIVRSVVEAFSGNVSEASVTTLLRALEPVRAELAAIEEPVSK